MAIWQFDFNLIEKDFYDLNLDPIFKNISKQSLEGISLVLPIRESWSKDIIIYGDNDKTCIKLLYENNYLEEVSVRLDLRSITKNILLKIVKFIKLNEAKILVNSNIVDPTLENLMKLIKESESYRFLKNPQKFLDSLPKNN